MTPADQAKLTPEALDEDETVILRANDPNAPDNVVLFNYELMEYHKVPVNAAQFHLTTHLDKSLGEIHHRESNDAKAQLAMQTQIAEKEKAVLEDIIKQVHTTACKRLFSLGCVAHTDVGDAAGRRHDLR